MDKTQDVRQLAKQRLQEIYAQMHVLGEEEKQINAYLSLREQEDEISNGPGILTEVPE